MARSALKYPCRIFTKGGKMDGKILRHVNAHRNVVGSCEKLMSVFLKKAKTTCKRMLQSALFHEIERWVGET